MRLIPTSELQTATAGRDRRPRVVGVGVVTRKLEAEPTTFGDLCFCFNFNWFMVTNRIDLDLLVSAPKFSITMEKMFATRFSTTTFEILCTRPLATSYVYVYKVKEFSYEMFSRLTSATDSVNTLLSRENVSHISSLVENLNNVSESMLNRESVEKFTRTVESANLVCDNANVMMSKISSLLDTVPEMLALKAKEVAFSFGSVLSKVIGSLIIFCSNPTLTTALGLALIHAPEFHSLITESNLFKSVEDIFSKVIFEYLKLPESITKTFTSFPSLSIFTGFEAPKAKKTNVVFDTVNKLRNSALETSKEINTVATALKNVEWFINKVLEILNWLKKNLDKAAEAPEVAFEKEKEKLMELLATTLELSSGQNVDPKVIAEGITFCGNFLKLAASLKDNLSINLATKVYHNLVDIRRKAESATYKPRPEPVVLYLHGSPGCGKSLVSEIIAKALCRFHGWDIESNIYAQPPASDYLDGYTGQKIHLIDDIGQAPDGTDWASFVQMVSTVKYIPNMADLSQKGITYTSEYIIATSNFADVTHNAVRDPNAVRRRCKFTFECSLSPRYTTTDGKLDYERALSESGPDGLFVPADHHVRNFLPSCNALMFDALNLYRTGMGFNAGDTPHEDLCKTPFEALVMMVEEHKRRSDLFEKAKKIESENLKKLKPSLDKLGNLHSSVALHASVEESDRFHDAEETVRLEAPLSEKVLKWIASRKEKLVETVKPLPSTISEFLSEKFDDAREAWLNATLSKKIAMVSGVVATFIGCVGLIKTVYSYLKPKADLEGAYDNTFFTGNRKRNVRRPLTKPVVGDEILPNTYHKISKNTFTIKIYTSDPSEDETEMIVMTCLGLRGNLYCTNTHAMLSAKFVEIRDKVFNLADCKVTHVERNGSKTDLTLIEVPNGALPHLKDLTPYLRKDSHLPSLMKPGIIMVRGNFVIDVLADNIKTFSKITTESGEHTDVICYKAMTTFGYCGAPVVTTDNADGKILGIHMASNGHGTAFATPIFLSDIPAVVNARDEGIKFTIGEAKSVYANTRTKITKSPAYAAFPVEKEPAALTGRDPRLNEDVRGPNFKVKLLDKYNGDMKTPFPGLDVGKDIVLGRLKKLIPHKLKGLNILEAINGIPGMERMDMRQASGYPYNTEGVKRRDLFYEKDGIYYPTPRLLEDIERSKSHPEEFPYTTFIKDELRATKKVTAGKSRLVEAGSLPVIVEGRMIFGNLFAIFNSNPGYKTMCAVGCDPDVHWTEFYHPMSQKANVWDYDYTGFDGSIPSCSFDALADLLSELIEDSESVRRYIANVKNSYHTDDGKLWRVEGAMPSGCCGTSVFNSLINAMLVFACCSEICPDFDHSEPLLLAYGDDIIIGSDQDLRPSKVAAWMGANTTFRITPADKGTVFTDESDIHMVRFLKRTFVPDPVAPCLIHPVIEKETFEQSVMWTKEGDFADTITALCGLAWHSGPKAYHAWCKAVADKMLENGCDYPDFTPYSLLRKKWFRKFEMDSFNGIDVCEMKF
uniref:Polyprotein n=2 Tax=unclassified Picornavirales TaxID=675074 RepID=A0AB38ZJS0_9VIRU